MPFVANDVRLLKFPSPTRWKVLFIEPCSPGHVPVASVCQPTPVLGGKRLERPFWPCTPVLISSRMVGMTLASAYFWTRSGRIPSAANMITVLSLWRAVAARASRLVSRHPLFRRLCHENGNEPNRRNTESHPVHVPSPFPPSDKPVCWFKPCDAIVFLCPMQSKSHPVTDAVTEPAVVPGSDTSIAPEC